MNIHRFLLIVEFVATVIMAVWLGWEVFSPKPFRLTPGNKPTPDISKCGPQGPPSITLDGSGVLVIENLTLDSSFRGFRLSDPPANWNYCAFGFDVPGAWSQQRLDEEIAAVRGAHR